MVSMDDNSLGRHRISTGRSFIDRFNVINDTARRVIVFILVLVLLSSGWTIITSRMDSSQPIIDHNKYSNVKPIIDLVATAPVEINPQASTDPTLWQVLGHNVIGTWTHVDNGQLRPELIDRWETSADGMEWTFHLKNGLKWSNDHTLTADDLVRSLQSNMTNGYDYADRLQATVVNVSAIDSKTVKIILNKPMAVLPYLLAGRLGAVWPSDSTVTNAVMKNGSMISQPVTSGPYFLESYTRSDDGNGTMVLGVSNGSQAKAIRNMQVTVKFVNEETATADAKAGRVQYAVSSANTGFPDGTVRGSSTRRLALAFNGRTDRPYPALGDKRFRQGIRMGINNADVMNAIGGAYTGGQSIGGAIVPGEVGYEDLTSLFPFDQKRARWTATSYFGIYPIDVILPDWARAAGEVISNDLQGIGQHARYEVLDSTAYSQRLQSNDYDVALIEVNGYDGLKDYLDGNATTGVDAPDTTTAYDAIYTAKTGEELQASIKNAARVQSDWSTIGWLAAAKTSVWSMNGWSKIPADLADVNLDLTMISNESIK